MIALAVLFLVVGLIMAVVVPFIWGSVHAMLELWWYLWVFLIEDVQALWRLMRGRRT